MQPGEPDHTVDSHVGHRGERGQSLGTGHDLHAGGNRAGEGRRQRFVPDGHHLGVMAPRLFGKPLDRAMRTEGDDVEPLG